MDKRALSVSFHPHSSKFPNNSELTPPMRLPYPQESKHQQEHSITITLSRDGYLRLTFESFRQVKIVHLFSGTDADRPSAMGSGASSHPITGYTEWVSHGTPAISIGWDWELTGAQGKAQLIQTGKPASNLMFVDQYGHDLGSEQTKLLTAAWLNTFTWQTETLRAVSA
jgi:hypothetical protein